MKRSLWTEPITEQISPAWPCPACASGTLAVVPNSLIEKETIESKQLYEVLCEPESITSTFSVWLKCHYGNCGEEAVVVGVGKIIMFGTLNPVDELNEGQPFKNYKKIYQPRFCWPMPDMFELPEKCPDKVKSELRAAFRLFWSDQAASAGRLRVSLERLIDHYHVPKHLKLHDRIVNFSEMDSEVREKLMALKWLGNAGSHRSKSISYDDLLDGFEILEFLIAELFDKRTARVAKLACQMRRKYDEKQKKLIATKLPDKTAAHQPDSGRG